MKLKTKNPGISFAIGIIVSTILLSVGLTVFESVNRVAEQGYDLEAKNKLFYLNETKFEEALYHHNKWGGKGIDFASGANDIENNWSISGRKADVLTGILEEYQTIEVPFYYKKDPSNNNDFEQITQDFNLDFSRYEFDEDGNETSTEIIKEIKRDNSSFNFPDNNNDTGFRNNVLISWAVTRKNKDGIIQTFVPRSDYTLNNEKPLCVNIFQGSTYTNQSSFFCEEYLNNGWEDDKIITSSREIIGYILPGQIKSNLKDFWDGRDSQAGTGNLDITNRKLSFRPLVQFYNQYDPTEKIKGIPWKLTVEEETIPTPTFTITTKSTLNGVGGKFTKSESVTLNEKTAISSFDNFNAE